MSDKGTVIDADAELADIVAAPETFESLGSNFLERISVFFISSSGQEATASI